MTAHKNIPSIAGYMFFGFFLAASSAALADPVILSCQGSGWPPFAITLDMTNKTVTFPATGTSNPFSIQVADNTIIWDENPSFWMKFQLDRVTLFLQGFGNDSSGASNGNHMSAQCQKAEKQL